MTTPFCGQARGRDRTKIMDQRRETIREAPQRVANKPAGSESRQPNVWIWLPGQSITGQYEALIGDDELVQDTNGRRFLRALSKKVNDTKEAR